MEGVDVIGDLGAAVAPEQHRAPDAISRTPAGFDVISEASQARLELQQYIVAVQSGALLNRRDARLDGGDLGDERVNPLWWVHITREVLPARVGIGRHLPILPVKQQREQQHRRTELDGCQPSRTHQC